MTQASVCEKNCWLEGINLAQRDLPCSSYSVGERLDPDKGLFLICRGPVGCLWGSGPERSCLEILGAGDMWEGWSCASGGCQAWAFGEVRGHWIKETRWLELLRDPVVEERFVRSLRQRQRRQHEWQLVLARGSIRARVAWQLLDLAERFGERDARTGEIFVGIHLTQTQQAQLCGSVRSQVWEALRGFEGQRWVICSPQGFWVRDEGALRKQSFEGL